MRGATLREFMLRVVEIDISIHAPHAGCDGLVSAETGKVIISIHAPHAGCDCNSAMSLCYDSISIHAPHAGCDA